MRRYGRIFDVKAEAEREQVTACLPFKDDGNDTDA